MRQQVSLMFGLPEPTRPNNVALQYASTYPEFLPLNHHNHKFFKQIHLEGFQTSQGRGRGRNFNKPKVICQVPGKSCHIALQSYHRFDMTCGRNVHPQFVTRGCFKSNKKTKMYSLFSFQSRTPTKTPKILFFENKLL